MDKNDTGYAVYNQSAQSRRKTRSMAETYPHLPDGRFDVIYADPPWDYRGKLQFDKSSKSRDKIDLSKNIFISSAAFEYPTLRSSELAKLNVRDIAKDDSMLFMWTTNPHLDQAIDLGKAWGFQYRTVAFVWNKMVHNPGQYTLSYCELCLLFKRGRIPRPRGARNVPQLVNSRRTRHSEKPVEVQHGIERMFPTQQKIELFARRRVDGWACWGLDLALHSGTPRTAGHSEQTPSAIESRA